MNDTPRNRIRSARLRGLAQLAAAIAVATTAGLPAAAADARAVMQTTIDAVLVVLNDPALDHPQRLAEIEKIAYARFDMETMSRLVIGRDWKRFTPEQKAAYQSEFKLYLANNYGDRINRYDQQQVEIIDERDEARGDKTVRTRIVGGEFDDARVDYRMREKNGEWRVIDVVIEGISTVSNFRDQFREVLSRGGPEHLLEKLREKNAQGPVEST
jgi:phospholipid transport system substrate-binding protein